MTRLTRKLLRILHKLFWCPWRESNPHSLRNTILSRARLPVPPHGHAAPSISEGRRAGQKENLQARGGLASASKIGQLLRVVVGAARRRGVMTQTSTLRMTWLDRLRAEPAAAAALAIFIGSTATIVGAWFFEFVLRLPPCP